MSVNNILLSSVFVFLLLFSTSCEKETQYPLNGPIPESDIVFMPDGDPVSPNTSITLGFINADGNNRQEYTFTLVGGSLSNFGFQMPQEYASHPRWSWSGDEIVFTIRDLPPNIRLIGESGKMYGKKCQDIYSSVLTFDINGNILHEITKNDQVHEEYLEKMLTTLIARYDLGTCQIISVFSIPLPHGSRVREINESSNGILVTSFHDWESDKEKILIYDPYTSETQILYGYHPSMTKDGAMLAYFDSDGALIVRTMETGEERLLKSVFPNFVGPGSGYRLMSMPGWSPDQKWLVYNTPKGSIYKINVETGDNTYLTYGWAPDWR